MNRVSAVVAAAFIAALAPTSAYASTWTVDDDKADCPNAAFTSIQAAVNQAAPLTPKDLTRKFRLLSLMTASPLKLIVSDTL